MFAAWKRAAVTQAPEAVPDEAAPAMTEEPRRPACGNARCTWPEHPGAVAARFAAAARQAARDPDPCADMPPAHPAPVTAAVPGAVAGWLLATVSPAGGLIAGGWTHTTPLSRAGALAEAALARRGETVPRLALCRVTVEEVING